MYSFCCPNGEQTKIVAFVTLFRMCGTASEIIAAGAANMIAKTQIIDAVKTVKGRVWEIKINYENFSPLFN